MISIGSHALLIALGVSTFILAAAMLGVFLRDRRLIRSAENGAYVLSGLLSVSSAALLWAFLTYDFSLKYVAEYSDRSLSLFYRIAAFWAGQEGSLLLWAWLLSVFFAIVVYQNRYRNRRLMPWVVAVFAIASLFFLSLMNFATSPFATLAQPPADGMGLNPLLQNPGMVFHPVTLYLGYVGFTVPFAFVIAALITGKLGETWIITTRRWTIFSWFFLFVGILVGAQWAYVELGWGGFWGWDPVENASLMPWLTATAYLHSVMIQERRGMLKLWNVSLVILTFVLVLFGTFITRSGIISSVHSFGVSLLAPYFFWFTGVIIIISAWLIAFRMRDLGGRNVMESLLSRESTFLFNNLVLIGIAFATFWGTVFPMISEAVQGVKITVSAPYFNQVSIPLGLLLLLLTGVCPLIAWRKATAKNFRTNFFWPLAITLGSAGFLAVAGLRNWIVLTSYAMSIFVTATIVIEFGKAIRARAQQAGRSYLRSFVDLFSLSNRRYGGYIIHFGVVLMILAITGKAFQVQTQATLSPGQEATLKNYVVRYDDLSVVPTKNKTSVSAKLSIFNGGDRIGVLRPAKDFYPKQEQPTTEVAYRSTLKEDLYVILAGFDKDSDVATFKLIINPLVMWLWIGGIVILVGTVIVMWPDKRERKILALSSRDETE